MISAWHLLWIVPLSASVGALILVLFAVVAEKDDEEGRGQ